MKIALILVSLAALGGGAYYLVKAGKLVAEPSFGSSAPTPPVKLIKMPTTGAQLAAAVRLGAKVPILFV